MAKALLYKKTLPAQMAAIIFPDFSCSFKICPTTSA